MTKTKSTTKASVSKTSVTKSSASAHSAPPVFIVFGYDEQQKPCGAQFVGDNPELVAKAAELMDLKVYKATTPDLAAVAKKLPVGRLYANGRGFVPNVRLALYMDLVAELGDVPQAALSTKDDNASTPVARGLPRTWDEIAPGHLVIAQEAAGYGWWEAIVIGRNDDMFTLRYRDYPKLPKFSRHRSAIGLMSPPSDQT